MLAFFVVLLVSFAVMNALPADGLLQACAQEAVLALMALAVVAFALPGSLRRCTVDVQHRSLVRFVAISLLVVGFIGGVISLVTWCISDAVNVSGAATSPLPSVGEVAKNLLLLLGICALTGIYEEAFMRVLGIEAFESALGTKRAVVTSALLFALLHVGVPDAPVSQLVLMQSALKFLQALLFGAILGTLYAQTRRLWPCALLHAGFDALYLGPRVFLMGALPATYASGATGDTVLLTVTIALLAATAIVLAKKVAQAS